MVFRSYRDGRVDARPSFSQLALAPRGASGAVRMGAGHGSARPRGFALRRRGVLAGHEQRELELAGSLVQRQQAPPVGLQADHGAHLAGGAALLVGKPHERRERARLAVGRVTCIVLSDTHARGTNHLE